jgi:hypothetical protein
VRLAKPAAHACWPEYRAGPTGRTPKRLALPTPEPARIQYRENENA